MPTTGLGFRYPAPGDAPNMPGDIQNLASDVNSYLTGFGAARVDNSGSTTITVTPAFTDCMVATYDGGVTFNVGSCISYSSGIYTILAAGVYRWDVTVAYPAASSAYRVQQFIHHNGTTDANGVQSFQFANGDPAQNVTTGGVIRCAASDTVQLGVNCNTSGLTGVNHRAFTITRVA